MLLFFLLVVKGKLQKNGRCCNIDFLSWYCRGVSENHATDELPGSDEAAACPARLAPAQACGGLALLDVSASQPSPQS